MNVLHLPPLTVITANDQLARAVEALAAAGRFALDTEANSLYVYHHRVCLIQLSSDAGDYIVDSLALTDLSSLAALVNDPTIEVTMHAAENDILLLNRDFGFRFATIFDTLWAARILGWRQFGLASLLQQHFDVTLDKRMQTTDWGQRPLAQAQLDYARLDTHYLLALRDREQAELEALGRWEEAEEMFATLAAATWEERDPPTFWSLSGASKLPPTQQAVLQELFNWREAEAQRRDIPPFKVLRSEVLIELCQRQPATAAELARIPGLPRKISPQWTHSLLRAIRNGQHQPAPEPPTRNHNYRRPDEAETARFDRLRAWRTATALARGVEPDVIFPNQTLLSIARANPATLSDLATMQLLGPWKLRTYGPQIIQAVRNE